jgi:hypothetical protein
MGEPASDLRCLPGVPDGTHPVGVLILRLQRSDARLQLIERSLNPIKVL